MTALAHLWALGQLVWRSRLVRVAMIAPGIVALLLMFGAVGYLSVTPSAEQDATASYGDADWTIQNVVPIRLGEDVPPGIVAAVTAAGARNAHLVLSGDDYVTVDGAPATPGMTGAGYFEMIGAGPYGGVFTLTKGRWSGAPGEVVLTERLAERLGGPTMITVFDRAATWRVVGVVRNEYSYSGEAVLAAPGTWLTIPDDGRHPTVLASAKLYWQGVPPSSVIEALVAVPGVTTTRDELARSAEVRAHGIEDPIEALTEPTLLWTTPMVTALLAGTVVPGLLAMGWLAKVGAGLNRVGVDRRTVRTSGWLALSAAVLVSVGLGLVAGSGLSLAARPAWHVIRNGQLPAMAIPWKMTGLIYASVALALVLILVLGPLGHQIRRIKIEHFDRQVLVLTAVAGISLIIANWSRSVVSTEGSTLVIIGACTLVAAVVALISAMLLPASDGAARRALATRRLRALTGRRLTVAILTFALGSTLGIATLFDTATHNLADQRIAELPPGSALLGTTTPSLPPGLQADFEKATGASRPIPVVMLELELGTRGSLWSVHVDDIERLVGGALSAEQQRIFSEGGVLVPAPFSEQVVDLPAESGTVNVLSAREVSVSRELAHGMLGIIADTTARQHGWTGLPGLFYVGLTDRQVSLSHDFRYSGRYDTDFVHAHIQPPPPSRPQGIFLVSILAGLGATVLVLVAFSLGSAVGMRSLTAGMAALGVPRFWLFTVLLWQCGWVTLVSFISGAASAIIGVAVIVLSQPGSRLIVPWDVYAIAAAACFLTTLLAALVGSARLRQSERFVTI